VTEGVVSCQAGSDTITGPLEHMPKAMGRVTQTHSDWKLYEISGLPILHGESACLCGPTKTEFTGWKSIIPSYLTT